MELRNLPCRILANYEGLSKYHKHKIGQICNCLACLCRLLLYQKLIDWINRPVSKKPTDFYRPISKKPNRPVSYLSRSYQKNRIQYQSTSLFLSYDEERTSIRKSPFLNPLPWKLPLKRDPILWKLKASVFRMRNQAPILNALLNCPGPVPGFLFWKQSAARHKVFMLKARTPHVAM